MNINSFTKERMKFARFFYDQGCIGFQHILVLIESEQPPYVPVYDESSELQFMYEYQRAKDGIESIGLAALSMLSSTLQIYMKEWLCRFERGKLKPFPKLKKGEPQGWFEVLKKYMVNCGVDFDRCPIEIDILKQLILARNRVQHAEDITSNSVTHLDKDLVRSNNQNLIFVKPTNTGSSYIWFKEPIVYVDDLIFDEVASTLDEFFEWLEKEYVRIRKA